MEIDGIIWLPEIVDKLETKHHVATNEVEDVLSANPIFKKVGRGNVAGEDLYRALGQDDYGRYLAVFFILKSTGDALVISARNMSETERKYYAKRKRQ